MRQGGILLITAAVLACTACLGGQGKLEVRPSANGLKAGSEPVSFRVAEARGHLALGNVALALQGFRKAAREDPASVAALAGIAQCYDQMRRFDLSRRHYEMALAVAPRDPTLLAAFAGSLDLQGRQAEAASVRRELAALAAESAPDVQIAESLPTPAAPPMAAPVGQSVTIALPPPRPVGTAQPVAIESQAMAVTPVGQSVTIALPPPRPAAEPKATNIASTGQATPHRRPRLERLSLTEVALVTGNGPRWVRPGAEPVRTAARATAPMPLEVRVLNAARVDKLAARTRSFLGRFGWRQVAVGDAAMVRAHSLIVYPQGRQAAATRLAARLGFATAERHNVRQVTILLGRDAAGHPGLRPAA